MKAIWLLVCIGFFFLVGCKDKAGQEQPSVDSTAITAGPANGVKLESQEGKFSVVLPDSFPSPEKSSEQVPTDVGPITMHLYTSSTAGGNTFVISYNDYPDFAFAKEIDRMMDDIRDGALKNMNATLESQKDFVFAGSPARSLDFSIVADSVRGFGRMQYFIIKPRLYQMIFLSNSDSTRHEQVIHQSFASFKLMK